MGAAAFLIFPHQPPTPPRIDPNYAGIPEAGEAAFKTYCSRCHRIQTPSGDILAGAGSDAGPNLWGVIGRTAGSSEYRYSSTMVNAGETGLVWNKNAISNYVADPNGYLQAHLNDDSVRGKMSFRLNTSAAPYAAKDIAAYLQTLSNS